VHCGQASGRGDSLSVNGQVGGDRRCARRVAGWRTAVGNLWIDGRNHPWSGRFRPWGKGGTSGRPGAPEHA